MNNSQLNIQYVPLSDLVLYEHGARIWSDDATEQLKESITRHGMIDPIIVNSAPKRKNVIIGGNFRASVLKELGYETVPVIYLNIPDIKKEEELYLRMNKNVGSWGEELLKEFEIDMLLDVGFGDEELQNLFDDVDLYEDDFDVTKAVEETKVATVKTGEVWQLGKHRLLISDSTNLDSVQKMMDGDLADIIWQDVPYNIGLSYGKGLGGNASYQGSFSSKDDSKKDSEYLAFLDKSMQVAKAIAKSNAHVFYWSDPNNIGWVQSLYDKNEIKKRRVCLWIKSNQNCTPKVAWNRVYEPCTYATLNKPYLNPNFRNANEILNQEVTTGNQVLDELHDMIDLWLVKRDSTQSYLHATQKPVALSEKPFKRCSAPGHIIFSGFAGSGSDLIAAEQLNRVWRGVEQDPIFGTVIIDRWESFTGLKATKLYENK